MISACCERGKMDGEVIDQIYQEDLHKKIVISRQIIEEEEMKKKKKYVKSEKM